MMTKQVTIEGGIYLNTKFGVDRWVSEQFSFLSGKLESFGEYVAVQAHALTFDLPDDYGQRPTQIKALEEQRSALTAQFQAAVTEINARITRLTAIDYTPPCEVVSDELPF